MYNTPVSTPQTLLNATAATSTHMAAAPGASVLQHSLESSGSDWSRIRHSPTANTDPEPFQSRGRGPKLDGTDDIHYTASQWALYINHVRIGGQALCIRDAEWPQLIVDEDEVVVEPPECKNPMPMELIDLIYNQRVKREGVTGCKAETEDEG
ncbi:hypothetical protein FRB94_000896 [Tulasnella sp. JGI-2019a]|nr:hypothetical protein FRB93_008162 [Tulasnella sp. JGI-2019a]KAG8988327.1 hypothetical protein FRB94_000896 [Tulasnella sp. JGI-2019a]